MAQVSESRDGEHKLHYRLTNDEWIRAVHELTESQKDVLYYLRTLDPFGDRHLNLGVREIARLLNYDPGTVSRALHFLGEKGYIDLEMVTVRVKVLSKGRVLCENNSVAPKQQPRSQCNKPDPGATVVASEQHLRSPCNTQGLEALQENGSGTPHTIHTFKPSHTPSNSTSGGIFSQTNQENGWDGDLFASTGQTHSSTEQQRLQPTDAVQDQNSAPTAAPVENAIASQTQRPEVSFSHALSLWRTGTPLNDIKPEFVEWVRKWLCTIPPERDRSRGDAVAYIRNQEATGDLSILQARAEEWLLSEYKARDLQQRQAIAVEPMVIAEQSSQVDPNAAANFRKMRGAVNRSRLQASSAEPSDCSEVLASISVQCNRLGWRPEQIREWFIANFGRSSDRLDEPELLEAAERLESLELAS